MCFADSVKLTAAKETKEEIKAKSDYIVKIQCDRADGETESLSPSHAFS